MFRLAKDVFHCPVCELESRLSAREFSEWIAYFNVEPWGEEIDQRLLADLVALTFNVNRKQGAAPLKPEDLLPRRRGQKRRQQSEQEMINTLRGFAKMYNAITKANQPDGR